jgi:hypothetical protein
MMRKKEVEFRIFREKPAMLSDYCFNQLRHNFASCDRSLRILRSASGLTLTQKLTSFEVLSTSLNRM